MLTLSTLVRQFEASLHGQQILSGNWKSKAEAYCIENIEFTKVVVNYQTKDFFCLHQALPLLSLKSLVGKLGRMTSDFRANRELPLRIAAVSAVAAYLAVTLGFTGTACGQGVGVGPMNPPKMSNPPNLPVPDRSLPGYDGWAVGTAPGGGYTKTGAAPAPSPPPWSVTLSTLYQYSNQRSRIGGFSFNINSVTLDLGARYDCSPFTSFDLSYTYAHARGTSPNADSEINEHDGFLRVVQPLNRIWDSGWWPADLGDSAPNQQLAIILAAGYGGTFSSISGSNVLLVNDSGQNFLGDALFDYQFAWFTKRSGDQNSWTHNYPNLLVELTSGIASDTIRLDSSSSAAATNLSEKQLNYRTIASITYSFQCRLGFLAAVEWDAPLVSDPFHGSRPDHASSAIFSAGLVYNIYPDRYTGKPAQTGGEEIGFGPFHLHRWTFGLLYSHTAFDPLVETNTVQCQISYSF